MKSYRFFFQRCLMLGLCVALLFTLDGCRRKKRSSSADIFSFDAPPSNVWVGYFRFDEYGSGDVGEEIPTAIFVGHTLTVRQTAQDSLRANLSASGIRHSSDLDCRVEEIDDTVHLYFQRYGENHNPTLGQYAKDTLLFSLVRTGYTITTRWHAYKPVHTTITQQRQGKVYFMKDNEDAVPNIDTVPFSAYWAEYTKSLRARDSVKVAYMTAFPLVGSNYVRPEGALTDLVSKTDFMLNYNIALFPAFRKVLEMKDSSAFRSSIKTERDNIYLPNGIVPQGAQMYRLDILSKEMLRFMGSAAATPSNASAADNPKELAKEQSDILKRQNKIAKELQKEYAWTLIVARLQGKYRVCYMGVAPKANEE